MTNKVKPFTGKPTTSLSRDNGVVKGKKNSVIILIALIVLVVAGGLWLGFRYLDFGLGSGKGGAEVELNENEKKELLAKIAEHIVIPSQQEPLIISINNAEQLISQQAFFAGAENGDMLLVYQDKALIYRPKQDVLINVGPVYLTNNEEQNQ